MTRALETATRTLLMCILLIFVAAFAYYIGHERGVLDAQAKAQHDALPSITIPMDEVTKP